jgi:hypothetical protein
VTLLLAAVTERAKLLEFAMFAQWAAASRCTAATNAKDAGIQFEHACCLQVTHGVLEVHVPKIAPAQDKQQRISVT